MKVAHIDSEHSFLRIFRTIVTTGIAYVVNYGITLVLTPYITDTVGTEAYGFVSLARQFAQYAVIVTTALNTYASRYLGIAYHTGDKKKLHVYFSSVFWGNVVLITGIFALALLFVLTLERWIRIPGDIVVDVKIPFLFMFLSLWISTVCSVFGCAGYIRNRLDLTGIFKTLSYLTNALVLILTYALFPAHICYVGAGTVASTLVVALSDIWITRKFLPDHSIKPVDFSLSAVKRLVMDGCWSSFNSVGELLNNGLDLIVCNQMLSSFAMGQLAIVKNMYTIISSLYVIVDQAFYPVFLKSYAENKMEKLLTELKLSMKLSGLFANLAFAGFAALGLVYYRLWVPGEDTVLLYRLTVITFLVVIPTGAVHPLYYIYTLTIKKRVPCLVTIAGGIFNVTAMYVLIRCAGMGIYAITWTTVIVMSVINFVTNPLYMARVLHLPYNTFYPAILRNVASCLILTVLFQGLARLYLPDTWLTLVLCAIVYVLFGTLFHLLIVCDKEDRKMLKKYIKNRSNRF